MGVFIRTSPHAKDEVICAKRASKQLSFPAQDTRVVIEVFIRSPDRIWQDGRRYMANGIVPDDFTPHGISQLNLFDEAHPTP